MSTECYNELQLAIINDIIDQSGPKLVLLDRKVVSKEHYNVVNYN